MSASELKNIQKACSITSSIISKAVKELKKVRFKTEKELYNFLVNEAKKRKCKIAFKPIVSSKKNAADIHHKASNTKLKKGFLIIDFGVKYKGYCSDCTRTVYLGKPSKKEKEIYNLVKLAQETALNHARPGVYAADIDLIARNILLKYFKHFLHSTGHGVGKKIHQSPNLKPRSRSILKKGNVITVEPGLYFKNKMGIRIEDTIVVANPPKILTKISKKLITL